MPGLRPIRTGPFAGRWHRGQAANGSGVFDPRRCQRPEASPLPPHPSGPCPMSKPAYSSDGIRCRGLRPAEDRRGACGPSIPSGRLMGRPPRTRRVPRPDSALPDRSPRAGNAAAAAELTVSDWVRGRVAAARLTREPAGWVGRRPPRRPDPGWAEAVGPRQWIRRWWSNWPGSEQPQPDRPPPHATRRRPDRGRPGHPAERSPPTCRTPRSVRVARAAGRTTRLVSRSCCRSSTGGCASRCGWGARRTQPRQAGPSGSRVAPKSWPSGPPGWRDHARPAECQQLTPDPQIRLVATFSSASELGTGVGQGRLDHLTTPRGYRWRFGSGVGWDPRAIGRRPDPDLWRAP